MLPPQMLSVVRVLAQCEASEDDWDGSTDNLAAPIRPPNYA